VNDTCAIALGRWQRRRRRENFHLVIKTKNKYAAIPSRREIDNSAFKNEPKQKIYNRGIASILTSNGTHKRQRCTKHEIGAGEFAKASLQTHKLRSHRWMDGWMDGWMNDGFLIHTRELPGTRQQRKTIYGSGFLLAWQHSRSGQCHDFAMQTMTHDCGYGG